MFTSGNNTMNFTLNISSFNRSGDL